jgi:hypothetical protein
MPGRKSPLVIQLEPTEQAALEHLVRSSTTPNGAAQRARIIRKLPHPAHLLTARTVSSPSRCIVPSIVCREKV